MYRRLLVVVVHIQRALGVLVESSETAYVIFHLEQEEYNKQCIAEIICFREIDLHGYKLRRHEHYEYDLPDYAACGDLKRCHECGGGGCQQECLKACVPDNHCFLPYRIVAGSHQVAYHCKSAESGYHKPS